MKIKLLIIGLIIGFLTTFAFSTSAASDFWKPFLDLFRPQKAENIAEETLGGYNLWRYSSGAVQPVVSSWDVLMPKSASTTGSLHTGQLSVGSSGNEYYFPSARGTNNQILKIDADGNLTWQTDATGGGGGGLGWSYDSESTLLTRSTTTDQTLIGGAATTSATAIFEVQGASLFDDLTAVDINATNTNVDNLTVYTIVSLPAESIEWADIGDVPTSTTDQLNEGSNNLYWTDARFDTRLIATTTWSGNLVVDGDVTGDNLNISNWDTAYGWGDHAGLYLTDINNQTLGQLSDVSTSSLAYGYLLSWDGSNWNSIATSTLKINSDDLVEGFTNLFQLTEEEVEDYVGGMLGGTETLITVAYQDGSNNIDFVVNDDLNLYDWSNADTDDLTEAGNLYYTDARVNAVIDATTTIDLLTIDVGTLIVSSSLSGTGFDNAFDDRLNASTTVLHSAGTTGDIMYHNGSNWVTLAIGSAGEVLEVSGGGIPEWDTDDSGASAGAAWEWDAGNSGLTPTTTGAGIYLTGSATTTANLYVTGTASSTTGFRVNDYFTVDSSGNVVGASFTGNLTGNADTATALAANGANCNAGEYALGVDASGAVESCTDATTEIDSAISTHAGDDDAHHALVTLTGAPNYLTLSGQEITLTVLDISDDTNLTAGDHITLTDDDLDVDDDFVLNTTDTMSGGLTMASASTTDTLYVGTYMMMNTAGDNFIYFDQATTEYLSWDDSPGEFDLTDDLNIAGTASSTTGFRVNDGFIADDGHGTTTESFEIGNGTNGVIIEVGATTTLRFY